MISCEQSKKFSKQSKPTQCCLSLAIAGWWCFLKRLFSVLTVSLFWILNMHLEVWSACCFAIGGLGLSCMTFASAVLSSLNSAYFLSCVFWSWNLSSLASAWCFLQVRSVSCPIHCVPLPIVECQNLIPPLSIYFIYCVIPLLRKPYWTDEGVILYSQIFHFSACTW